MRTFGESANTGLIHHPKLHVELRKQHRQTVEQIETHKQILTLLAAIVVVSILTVSATTIASAGKPDKGTTIQSGTLLDSRGEVITLGFDQWGYNYQGRMFNGLYCDAYRDAAWCQPYEDVKLSMKWNGTWLSNVDRDDDGLLDRHYGHASYIGSGAWLTNHQSGTYELDGKTIKWNYFVKIVAAPADATKTGGVWYAANGDEIGPVIWGAFAIVQQVENDPGSDIHGSQYVSPHRAGLGNW